MGKKKRDIEFFESMLKEVQETCYNLSPSIKSSHRKGFVEACEVYHEAYSERKDVEEDLERSVEAKATEVVITKKQEELEKKVKGQHKAMKKAMKAANKIFERLDINSNEPLQEAILKGTILLDATPAGLARFCEEDKINGKLIEALLAKPDLMKEMISCGGAKGGNYGNAMKIYTKIMASLPEEEDKFTPVNKKLAMAVALELAAPMFEFDTKIQVDPVARFEHYDKAHRKGELDPAFPNFSTWEMRHIVNCDATNEQLQWGRDVLFTYAPYITTVVDTKWKYLYVLKSDVLTRNPSWTSSPRTYQQVLSGGGKDAPNAWFGRFICKAFGIPTWGAKQAARVGLTRWTPTGWEAMLGMDWDLCAWEDMPGAEFKAEVDARASNSQEDYYNSLILLESLANVLDSRRDGGEAVEEDKGVLNPLKIWRSLSIIQKALMMQPPSEDAFQRDKKGLVVTKVEKYLEAFETETPNETIAVDDSGIVTIPASAAAFSSDLVMTIPNVVKGKQLNFLADGYVEFELPDELPTDQKYNMKIELCTVHLKQSPLGVSIDEGVASMPQLVTIPYTIGEWETLEAATIKASGGSILKFSRPKPSFGLAIKKIILEPVS